jgi:hypothetical protein
MKRKPALVALPAALLLAACAADLDPPDLGSGSVGAIAGGSGGQASGSAAASSGASGAARSGTSSRLGPIAGASSGGASPGSEQPWFGDAFSVLSGNRNEAPIDTHEVVAMVAPRGLFIMDNPSIPNLGPRSAHVAALAGAEVYEALGAGDNISYVSAVADGSHCAQRPEWTAPLRDNIQKFLKKTASAPGLISAAAKATGDLATWRDWDTPTLD